MTKIGIIGAMELEVEQLKKEMNVTAVVKKAGMDFFEGTLGGAPVVIVRSGIGKVNAALCVQILADVFWVSHVINTGVAGSLNADLDIPNVYSVVSDAFTSMYNATLQMIQSGVHDILYFYNARSYSGKHKLSGFRAAMEEKALLDSEALIQFYQGPPEDIHAMVGHLEAVHDRGTAFHGVIAADDTLGLAAVKYARKMGYRIPEDFSILGYNNTMLTSCCEPELTSIDNKLETLCRHLISTLLGVLEGNGMPKKTVFSGEIVRRGTTR